MGQTLSCFITDDRHPIPSLALWVDAGIEEARERARRDLLANPHHHAIEVRDGDQLVFAMRREDILGPHAASHAARASERPEAAG